MAIESSNRSPSPMSIRQNPNPNPNFSNSRNHTENRGDISVRRSANGSPFSKASVVAHPTPWCSNSKTASANSPAPADHARRSSFSKETAGLLRDSNEHKENKKPNPNSIRGSKNFMSPTISAVSKVNPSPRKKALAERNEAVRTSASLSDGKFLFFAGAGDDDLKGETENCEFQNEIIHKKEVTHVSICEAKKRVTFDDDVVVLSPEVFPGSDPDVPSESLSFVTEMIKQTDFAENEQKEPCLSISKAAAAAAFVSSPVPPSPIAPLDADPSIPSYDPKTNFLSPRPQFLRYNPDRKVALYLENHQPKNLEDTLSSETCSDNDVESNAEEVHAQEAESEFLGSSVSSSSVVEEIKLESPGDSTQQAHEEEMCVEEEEEMSDDEEETCDVSKPRFLTKWRAITWLALFGVVVFLSSMIASNAPEESVLSKVYQYDIYEFARADFRGSLHSMRKWSATYLPLMISSFRETAFDDFSGSHFVNYSALVCDANDPFIEHRASGFPRVEEVEKVVAEANLEEVEVQSGPQVEEAESQPVIKYVAFEEPLIEDVASEEVGVVEDIASEEPVIKDVAFEEPVIENESFEQTRFIEKIESGNEVVLDDSEGLNSYSTVAEFGEEEGLVLESLTIEGSDGNQQQVLGAQGAVAFLVTSLCVATAFSALAMFAKYKKAGNKPISTEQAKVLTTKDASFCGNPSHASQLEAVDMDAETYNPSAMSSYSIYDKTEARESESEAQSKEMKQSRRNNYKRESLASSSSEYTRGSASYGSFTTYSIMPTKSGDEEFVTPVRRSSRIRKQVVSP